MRKVWGLYLGLLDSHPLVTKSLSTGFLMGTGDILAQRLEYSIHNKDNNKNSNENEKNNKFKLNYKRVITMTTVGIVYSGPLLHYWYRSLDKMIKGESRVVAVKKMLVDQVLFAPFAIGGFMTVMNFINNKGELKNLENLPMDLAYAVQVNWLLWPAAQVVNFSFVPPNLRVLYSSVVSIFWSMFLSHISFDNNKNDTPTSTTQDNKIKEIN